MTQISVISGTAVVVPGNDVDTDRIIPARFLKEITFDNMGNYLFYDQRFDESGATLEHPLNAAAFKGASIMVVGRNFGCGSSREHAAQAVKRFGIKAVVGESFGEIFAGNCLSLGVPVVTLPPEQLAELAVYIQENPAQKFELSLLDNVLKSPVHSWPVFCDAAKRKALLSGAWDAISTLKENSVLIKRTAAELPYLKWLK